MVQPHVKIKITNPPPHQATLSTWPGQPNPQVKKCFQIYSHTHLLDAVCFFCFVFDSTSSSRSFCVKLSGQDPIFKAHTTLSKALQLIETRSMSLKELAEELRDWAGARQIWTRLEKESAPFIVSKGSAVSIIIIWKRFGSTRTPLTAGCLNKLKSRGRRVSIREVTKKPKITLTLTPQIPTWDAESFRPAGTAAARHHNWAVEQSGVMEDSCERTTWKAA